MSDTLDLLKMIALPKLTMFSVPEFFRSEHWGSDAIGVALFGLPTLLLCSPFIAIHNNTADLKSAALLGVPVQVRARLL